MNLDRLRTFQAVTATLHFGRAAEQLGLSQPAVSQQVAHLEEELGTALFERIGRRIYLTPAGQALSVEAGRIFAAIDRATEAVRALSSGEAGSLRVGASTTPGIYLVPEVLGRFRSDLPQVKLAFRIANSAEIERALLANELDLGIAGARFDHEELFEVTLGQDRIMAIGSPALLGRTRRLRSDDLARWPLLAREQGSGTQAAVADALARRGARLTPAFELPSPEALVHAAAAGLGIAFVPRRAARDVLRTRAVVELRVEGLEIVRPIQAAHHRDKRVTPAMRDVMELLRARMRQPV